MEQVSVAGRKSPKIANGDKGDSDWWLRRWRVKRRREHHYDHNERHAGIWQSCPKCRDDFPTEIYVWYGTNEYNLEKLVNPPDYAPRTCVGCGTILSLSEDGYSRGPDGYRCDVCTDKALAERVKQRTAGS